MIILITGTATSGKSTVARELLKRGYVTYDTEHNGISAWYNKLTGTRDADFGEVTERTKAWMDEHEWRISMDWVNTIAKQAMNSLVFLCGGGANDREVRTLCQQVVWLKSTEATIRARVVIPRDHTYGTRPHELAQAIKDNEEKETEYRHYGAVIVDATQPIENVIAQILQAVG